MKNEKALKLLLELKMSIKVLLTDISEKNKLKINNDLFFEKDNGDEIYAYDICDNDTVYLPFNYDLNIFKILLRSILILTSCPQLQCFFC